MGFFSGIFKSRNVPQNSTICSAYRFLFGSTFGKIVMECSSMQMTAVYSCVCILAAAGLPLQFYRYAEDRSKEKAYDNPLYFLLHDEPEFKQKIVRLVLEEDQTIKSVKKEYFLGEGTVRG